MPSLRSLVLVLFSLVWTPAVAQNLTPAQLQSDFNFLRQALEKQHPALYHYTPKNRMDQVFDSIQAQLQKPLSAQAFYSLLSLLNQEVKDGHTTLLPVQSEEEALYLPFRFTLVAGELYIDRNLSNDSNLPIWVKVLSINGSSTSFILNEMRKRLSRDAFSLAYPDWVLSKYFRSYFQFFFGSFPEFRILYSSGSGQDSLFVQGLTYTQIQQNQLRNYPSKSLEKGVDFSFYPAKSAAYLQIKDFHNSNYKAIYHQSFKKEIKSFFDSVRRSSCQAVVLDLRDNQGGDIQNGVYLLSFLLQQPFQMVQQYLGKSGKPCSGPQKGFHKPQKQAFKGAVTVLVNGGSFSNSVLVSKALKRAGRAQFIGSEPGGSPKGFCGFSHSITLPNSKIQVDIPNKILVLDSGYFQQNLKPFPFVDQACNPLLSDFMSHRDACLDKALDFSNKRK